MNKTEQAAAIRAAKNGDRKAFEQLYSDYRDKLYFFVLKNVGSREAAEDIVSETFLDAMQSVGSLKAEEAFGSWLYSIAYRKCIRHSEDNSRVAHFDSEEEQELAMSDYGLNEPIQLPEDYAVNLQRQEQLKAVIDRLSPEQRSAVILYYYNEQSLSEVAKTLGISESAAGKRLFDARKKIKTKIEKLMKNGAFCVAPLGAVLESSLDSEYAAGAVKASATVKGVSAVKIAAVSTAAVVAVGVPAGLFGLNGGWGGDAPIEDSSVLDLAPDSSDIDSEKSAIESDSDDDSMQNSTDNLSGESGAVRIFPDDFLESLTSSVTFKDFDETWYTIEGDELTEVKEMLSGIEGVPCDDPELSGWYMFDIDMAEEISMVHSLIMTGNYVCLDGVMYKNDEPDNGRELAEYFREHGVVKTKTTPLNGTTAEFELVNYNSDSRSGYAVSDVYGLASFFVPEESADAFDKYDPPHPGLILNITWSGNVAETYPVVLENVTAVYVTDEREDFIKKCLDPVVTSCLLAGDEADVYAAVDKINGLNEREKEGLSWMAENKLYNIHDGDISIRDYSLELLDLLDYRYGTNDGLPEYSLTADDGTVYQINISSKWVWRGNDHEAVIYDELAQLLEMYKDEIGLQPVNWN